MQLRRRRAYLRSREVPVSLFDSTKTSLNELLDDISKGKLQLPDFQRGWVWNDEHIRSLLVSVARSFPIGAVMLLETGGDVHFQTRPVAGVDIANGTEAERLILDGQQRLTSLTQVFKSKAPVETRDDKNRSIKRHYYVDIEKALGNGPETLEDAIVGVDESRRITSHFGKQVVLDVSTPELEYQHFCFPLSDALNSDDWEEGLQASQPDRFKTYMDFRKRILGPIRSYSLPVIALKKENSKEAVCLVFEKVNTGGVPLTVFELVTASFAAEGFNLRKHWYGEGETKGISATLAKRPLLKGVQPTDFLQGISLLRTYGKRNEEVAEGKTGKDLTPVSAKREHVLAITCAAYVELNQRLLAGFIEADKFLRKQGFFQPEFLPYRPQLIPLAAVMAVLGERWLEPKVHDQLARWFWCGVFGELYGSATETRIALDLQQLLDWISNGRSEPKTITDAAFQPGRLDSLRTRTSAAYRGLYVLLQAEGAEDFFWKAKMSWIDQDERAIDIHHIFPRKWCETQRIHSREFDSIVNKTAVSAKANKKVGGAAPSEYLAKLQRDPNVDLDDAGMDAILKTHRIDPALLRADDFNGFYAARKAALLDLVEKAMGKQAEQGAGSAADDGYEGEPEE